MGKKQKAILFFLFFLGFTLRRSFTFYHYHYSFCHFSFLNVILLFPFSILCLDKTLVIF
ncbi:hypothetical protein BDF20DRAFT_845755 [Mycotypha africana]|uniref:uncharacterized protein n=1 Tax=Mycotypha africana TaxID=64632 RepID=UPI0023009370|nr:uncharacterized protein BDF20DRAFT_845755 [Mycotypha africana]KAI8991664.1 hypothetical protein BDF20DRAFT_845755 [Mycotypha africana]